VAVTVVDPDRVLADQLHPQPEQAVLLPRGDLLPRLVHQGPPTVTEEAPRLDLGLLDRLARHRLDRIDPQASDPHFAPQALLGRTRSIAATTSAESGSTRERNRATGSPDGSTTHFSKFQPTSPASPEASATCASSVKPSCRSGPFTSTLPIVGKVTP